MCIVCVWPLYTLCHSCRFGGRCRSTVPAGRRGAGQDSLEHLEEEPLLQTAGRLQDVLARVPQSIQAKPDLWVPSSTGSHVCLHYSFVCVCVSKMGFNLNDAEKGGKFYKTWILSEIMWVILLGWVPPTVFLTCTSFCYYSASSPFRSQQ